MKILNPELLKAALAPNGPTTKYIMNESGVAHKLSGDGTFSRHAPSLSGTEHLDRILGLCGAQVNGFAGKIVLGLDEAHGSASGAHEHGVRGCHGALHLDPR